MKAGKKDLEFSNIAEELFPDLYEYDDFDTELSTTELIKLMLITQARDNKLALNNQID